MPLFALTFAGSSLRNAYAMTNYADAKAGLERIFRQLAGESSAARSLEEGMEETLTVRRLRAGELLRRSLATANPIESCLSTVGKSSAQRETLARR